MNGWFVFAVVIGVYAAIDIYFLVKLFRMDTEARKRKAGGRP